MQTSARSELPARSTLCCRLLQPFEYPQAQRTVSELSLAKTQGPVVSDCESARGPITATHLYDEDFKGSNFDSFRSRTAERSAASRASCRCAGEFNTCFTLVSSTYGCSKRPSLIFISRIGRTASSSSASVILAAFRRSGRFFE